MISKQEYIDLVTKDPHARNAALAVAWIAIRTFPALRATTEEFERILYGGGKNINPEEKETDGL